MNVFEFQRLIAEGKPLEGAEMVAFMREQSDESRKLQFELNCQYHSPEDVRKLFSKIIGSNVDETFRLFPPFYTDIPIQYQSVPKHKIDC